MSAIRGRRGLVALAVVLLWAVCAPIQAQEGAATWGDWAAVRVHWWEGVRQEPSWLTNRGVWAIGVRALFGTAVLRQEPGVGR